MTSEPGTRTEIEQALVAALARAEKCCREHDQLGEYDAECAMEALYERLADLDGDVEDIPDQRETTETPLEAEVSDG